MSLMNAVSRVVNTAYDVGIRNADLKAKQQMANQRAQNIKEAKEYQKEHLTYFGGKFYKEVKV